MLYRCCWEKSRNFFGADFKKISIIYYTRYQMIYQMVYHIIYNSWFIQLNHSHCFWNQWHTIVHALLVLLRKDYEFLRSRFQENFDYILYIRYHLISNITYNSWFILLNHRCCFWNHWHTIVHALSVLLRKEYDFLRSRFQENFDYMLY